MRVYKKLGFVAVAGMVCMITMSAYSTCYNLYDCSDRLDYDACLDCSEGSIEWCGLKQAVFQESPGILFKQPDLFLGGGEWEEAWGVNPAHDCFAIGECTHGENPLPPTQCDNLDGERGYYCDGPIIWTWVSGYVTWDTLECE